MKNCIKCGQEVEDSTAYCPKCGYHFLDSKTKDDYFDNDYSTQSKGDTYGHFNDSKSDYDNMSSPEEFRSSISPRRILSVVLSIAAIVIVGLIVVAIIR